MHHATKKWLILKISSAVLIPLMFWFILNFVSIYNANYADIVGFFSTTVNSSLFSLFIIFAFIFFALTISEIFEDYIQDESLKNFSTKILYFSAIIIPIITILTLFNLN
jgi:succinate dehydrogenase / fumarate reductase, membrane anchor subunit